MDVRAELCALKKDAAEEGQRRVDLLVDLMVQRVYEVAAGWKKDGNFSTAFYVGTYALKPDDIYEFESWNGSVSSTKNAATSDVGSFSVAITRQHTVCAMQHDGECSCGGEMDVYFLPYTK